MTTMITECLCYTDCSLMELWNLPATNTTFLHNVSLDDADVMYASCYDESVGIAVLKNATLNTNTVAYYNGTTPDSRVCFVCDENSGYKPNTTSNERVCQSDAAWSGSPIICGRLLVMGTLDFAQHSYTLGILVLSMLDNLPLGWQRHGLI